MWTDANMWEHRSMRSHRPTPLYLEQLIRPKPPATQEETGEGAGPAGERRAPPCQREANGTERNEQRPSPRTARPVEGLNLLARDPSLGQAVYFAMEEKVTRPPSARSFPFLFLLLKKEVIFSPKRPVRSIPSGTDSTALCRQSLTTRVG